MKKRILSFILGALCLCTFLGGCGKEGGNKAAEREKYRYTEGVHQLVAPETDEYMVQSGKTEYKILVPEKSDARMVVAEAELTYFFEEATGIKLTTVQEPAGGLSHTADGKYISLGNTKMLQSSGVDVKADVIGSQGVRIATKDKTVYITGATTDGTLNAIYTFLNIMFDYDQYAYDCFTINKMNSAKLRAFDVVDVPDIEMRGSPATLTDMNPDNLQYRLRYNVYSDYFLPIGDTENGRAEHVIHNTSNAIPRDAETSRETWFSDQSGQGDDNTQLCYTAHGNQEDYEALVERAAYIISRSLIKYTPEYYPLRNVVTFTQEDNANTMCNCQWCSEAKAKYGTQSALALIMANNIRAKLEEWMNLPENAEYRRDNLTLIFFAYAAFVEAPAHYDEEQGKYVINHPDLKMRDDVGVFYAISSGLSYQTNLYDELSEEGIQNSLKWFDISSSVYLWTYNANFGNFLFRTAGASFYDTDAYQFFAAGGAKFMFMQSVMPGANVTSFQMLDYYLDSKMQWDTTQDISVLTQKWFKAMYKEAADVMFDLYRKQNDWAIIVAYETKKITQTGIINYSVGREFWRYEMLKDWLNDIDTARTLIAKYQTTNPELYKVLKEHIDIEWVCPAYYMLNFNEDSLTTEKYNEMVMYFKTDIATLKEFRFSERSTTTIGTWCAALSLR